jgi:predicted nucleic acid-binding protein
VLVEAGSDVADQLWETADTALTCRLFYPEARAALASAQRMERITGRALRQAVRELDAIGDELHVIELDRDLAHSAGELAERRSLRGYDAVHLAAALAVEDPDLVVAAWDDDLARAALAEQRVVVPPP